MKSTTHCSSKRITSSNDTTISEMSSFISASNITTERNARSKSNGSLIFGIDENVKKNISTRLVLLLPHRILLFQEVFPLISTKNHDSIR